jgi:hypothetical protein
MRDWPATLITVELKILNGPAGILSLSDASGRSLSCLSLTIVGLRVAARDCGR